MASNNGVKLVPLLEVKEEARLLQLFTDSPSNILATT